ncbi:MAG TPA: hypothetical protein VN278_06835 [Methanosarcina sp.]|nr:hypothetical protein [Methanosarcina sp.]
MTLDCEKLWNKSKNDLPPHQVALTEHFIRITKSFEICWICGDDEDVHIGKVPSDEGLVVEGLFCPTCTFIQKTQYGTEIEDLTPLKWALEWDKDVEKYPKEWEKHKNMRHMEEFKKLGGGFKP